MTVLEAVQLFSSFYTRATDPKRLLERLQLWEKRNAFYTTLSGGQKQRVALALAMVNEPQLVFLDEPTTGLDPQVRLEIHGLIQELRNANSSIVITTHYIEEAERLCDRVAIVDAGKIIEIGTPREIQQRVLGDSIVELKTVEELPLDLPVFAEQSRSAIEGRTITIHTRKPAKTLVEAVKWVDGQGIEIDDVRLKHPTLEDVFIELTGKKLRE
jgi:ABC-2 type transport system ATP-binding protein